MRKIADSTVRRLSLYLRFLEEFEGHGVATVSSDALAQRGGTTSAQVRKDLSFFGSFGKRGLGYDVHELATTMRSILGLGKRYRVALVGAGKIGARWPSTAVSVSAASTSCRSSTPTPPRSGRAGTGCQCWM